MLRLRFTNIVLGMSAAVALICVAGTLFAMPRVAVVVGDEASQLESFAADQLCGYLEKLFGLKTMPETELGDDCQMGFLIGSPQTNAAVAATLDGDGWPQLGKQGLVLKRGRLKKTPVLVVGGGSPQATLWAVYELVERWGVRYLLQGDLFPDPPLPQLNEHKPGEVEAALRLPRRDVVMEPNFPIRGWRVINDFAMGPEGWGIDDYRPVLDQLTKMKFNRIVLATYPWQPFLHLEFKGVKRHSASLWFNYHYPITDDMPGRQLFGDEPEFWNPDMPLDATYDELVAAAQQHVRSIMAHAHQRGMECVMTAVLVEYPPEFAAVLADTEQIRQLGALNVVPGPKVGVDDPTLADLAATVARTTVNTYPEADRLQINNVEFRQWTSSYEKSWKALDSKYNLSSHRKLEDILPDPNSNHRDVIELKGDIVALYFYDRLFRERNILKETKRPDMPLTFKSMAPALYPLLPYILPPDAEIHVGGYTASSVDRPSDALRLLPADKIQATVYFTLHDDNVGVVPQLTTGSLHEMAAQVRRDGWAGFQTRYWLIGDHQLCVAYLARSSWDASTTPESVYRDYIQRACGKESVADMLEMLRELEAVTVNLEAHGQGLSFPIPGMIMGKWKPDPMPSHFVKDRDGYRRALGAALRARDKSSESGKQYIDFWIGRLKFGIGYLDTVESVRRAAMAEEKKDNTQAQRHVAIALVSAFEAIESYAAVAWNQSDRGAIATMGEYVYRPLKAKLKELQNGDE